MDELSDSAALPSSPGGARSQIRRLVRELGNGAGKRAVSAEELAQLREFFGHQVLRRHPDDYVVRKYVAHVEVERQGGFWLLQP